MNKQQALDFVNIALKKMLDKQDEGLIISETIMTEIFNEMIDELSETKEVE